MKDAKKKFYNTDWKNTMDGIEFLKTENKRDRMICRLPTCEENVKAAKIKKLKYRAMAICALKKLKLGDEE